MTNLLFILLFHSICGLSFAEADFDEIDRQEDNISDDLENYISLKKELTYLLEVTETDLNKTNYSKNSELIDLYDEIQNSDIISSSVKERVKKIHEFHLYQ